MRNRLTAAEAELLEASRRKFAFDQGRNHARWKNAVKAYNRELEAERKRCEHLVRAIQGAGMVA